MQPDRLPKGLLKTLSLPSHDIFFSSASSWEIQIKIGLGKLSLNENLQQIIEREIKNNSLIILPVHLQHTWKLEKLLPLHKDPFDRILIAQALSEDLVIATKDPLIKNYNLVETIWD
jgi:PIN domain nuclease of toxin-antitoxin system